ncbi:MAG: efflux RND transporter periplasmic adaptor subunit, partial [Bacillota bacterium]
VLDLDNNPHIFVVEDGTAQKQQVTTGIISEDRVEIVSGLSAGDRIIIRGQNTLESGQMVEVISE